MVGAAAGRRRPPLSLLLCFGFAFAFKAEGRNGGSHGRNGRAFALRPMRNECSVYQVTRLKNDSCKVTEDFAQDVSEN